MKPLFFYIPEASKKDPFRVEPPRVGEHTPGAKMTIHARLSSASIPYFSESRVGGP